MSFRVRRVLLGAALVLTAAPTAAPPARPPARAAPVAAPVALPDAVGGDGLATHELVVDPTAAPLPPVSAAGFVVADLDTGGVLAGKDPHGLYAPASTLKMLTALALLPRLDPAMLVTPSRDDVNVDGTRVGLVTELQYPVSELFGALLISSANDAANALAGTAGGPDATAALMNAEAVGLQARDTHAVNPSGLDAPGQVSSAYDLALVARAGLARPDFQTYVQTRISSVSAPAGLRIEIDSHNRLLASYPGAFGVKNGYTDLARASFVGAATRDGHSMLVAMMRAEPVIWNDAAALLDWGFAARAAGVSPVGRLVDPLPRTSDGGPGSPAASPAGSPRAATAGPAPPTAAVAPRPAGGQAWSTREPAAAAGGGVVVLAALTAISRRRRRR